MPKEIVKPKKVEPKKVQPKKVQPKKVVKRLKIKSDCCKTKKVEPADVHSEHCTPYIKCIKLNHPLPQKGWISFYYCKDHPECIQSFFTKDGIKELLLKSKFKIK